jgi:DNA-binding MarR family transcriptional regulator
MHELKEYIQNTLGIDLKIVALNESQNKKLPVYLNSGYTLYMANLFNRDIVFAENKNEFTTNSLTKHLKVMKRLFNTDVVVVIPQLESYKRLRLIQKGIPFIVPGKQMFMPELFIDLKDFGTRQKQVPKIMTPAAQVLLLYHLQIESIEGINFKNIARKLLYDSATITRSARYLEQMNFCTIKGTKDKRLHFGMPKKELWESVKPYMHTPVKKTKYFNGYLIDNNLLKANNCALSHYSDLNEDDFEYYAVKPGSLKLLYEANFKETPYKEGNICIEEWTYDPGLLSKSKFVDRLSLYLCYINDTNERVGMATDKLEKDVKW